MKKNFLLILIFNSLFATQIELNYNVEFGKLFSGSGKATIEIIKEDGNYSIILTSKTEGYLKILSANRIEVYESHGTIKNNILIPDKFIIKRINNFKTKIDTYSFLHQENEVNIKKVRIDDGETVKFKDKSKFYAKNDILTLLFNLKFLLNEKINYEFYAIGANKFDGKVDIKVKNSNPNMILDVKMDKKDLKDSKFFITLDQEFLPKELFLENVEFFGDVNATLKERK